MDDSQVGWLAPLVERRRAGAWGKTMPWSELVHGVKA
jgi:hypothetical protein